MDTINNLIKITELTRDLNISSRTLRYYEQVGLIKSVRPKFEAYRYYDDEAIERLHQIMILRKMQIPIRDIIKIYESDEISNVVEVFCRKIEEINKEVTALSELKSIINTFLQRMVESGMKSINAMPLLYEEMENQFNLIENQHSIEYSDLDNISKKLEKSVDIAIVSLSDMRVISSYLKKNHGVSDVSGFWRYMQSEGIMPGKPGNHEMFEFQTNAGEVVILHVADDYKNDSIYSDYIFPGGLYASANAYADEDLHQKLQMIIKSFDENSFYQIDYTNDGNLRHPVLIEELISPDDKRSLLCIYVPVKKRIANYELFDEPKEILSESISLAEIEDSNPILWRKDIPLDEITPVNGPHYLILDSGEASYVGWIRTRVLSTNVSVKLPYRIDMDVKIMDDGKFGYGSDEGSIIIYRGDDQTYMSMSGECFGINTENHVVESLNSPVRQEAIEFRQPIFLNHYKIPGRGSIKYNEYNHLTWIVGENHLAVIINGEIRYCGTDFPYMSLDLGRDEPKNIYIGSNGQAMKYFKSISVSQLEYNQKNILKNKELIMITKQSNNIISNIHRLVTDEYGENFWFNGCTKYVMECLGETDYDYLFFAGISGDQFTQYYPKHNYMGDSFSSCMLSCNSNSYLRESGDCFEFCEGESGYAERIFERCGYSSTFVSNRMLRKNTEMYLNTLVSYIDKGVPVIFWGLGEPSMGVFVGYEEHGSRLLYITGNNDSPESISLEKALEIPDPSWSEKFGWIFVGEKKENKELADIYRKAIIDLPKLLVTETPEFFLGADAFRAWANDVENGKFDSVKPEEFDPWFYYSTYICALATIGSCCHGFLDKARRLNPDMTFLEDVSRLYHDYEDLWNRTEGNLEALGGGFNVTLGALQDKERREKIATKLRDFADVTDEIIKVLNSGIKNTEHS